MAGAGVSAVVAMARAGVRASRNERSLAARLGLELLAPRQLAGSRYRFFLHYDAQGLGLYRNPGDNAGPVRVDFGSGAVRYRVADRLRKQSLLKAVAVKGNACPTVLDATAGLGRDAYLFASAGCDVVMLENSTVIHALLQDGLDRGRALSPVELQALARMTLRLGDFLMLDLSRDRFDVVYLDPMFPPGKGTALAKKEMQSLRELLGVEYCNGMLAKAKSVAAKRVVVKRARHSPWLDEEKPDLGFYGSRNRYDVYLRHR